MEKEFIITKNKFNSRYSIQISPEKYNDSKNFVKNNENTQNIEPWRRINIGGIRKETKIYIATYIMKKDQKSSWFTNILSAKSFLKSRLPQKYSKLVENLYEDSSENFFLDEDICKISIGSVIY